ncbi:SAM-dependent methyltransferase [Streptomyces olivoverticillatus]|uniref:SAM-dependent methyltransferase n=1 Tax=Streptomyces olivoverticillatus TaxID=66427 RepID=A0A7W7PIL4_9ACTN|nr:SAM-dependent methyltransferase [Streptomyces olivoverticillatus]
MTYTSLLHGDALVDTQVNARAWNSIAAQKPVGDGPPQKGTVPDDIEWTCWPGHGPGAAFLGDLVGRRVAELGCGTGEHTAYAAARGARLALGVDIAVGRIQQARARFGHLPAAIWTVGDAAEVLARLPRLDACFSIYGALWYSDPARLLPVIRNRLKPGGLLAFTVNAPRPAELPGRRVDNLTLDTGARLPVVHYSYDVDAWRQLLTASGLTTDTVLTVDDPVGRCYRTLVLRARRPVEE